VAVVPGGGGPASSTLSARRMPVSKTGGGPETIEPSEPGARSRRAMTAVAWRWPSCSRPAALERQQHARSCQHGAHQIALRPAISSAASTGTARSIRAETRKKNHGWGTPADADGRYGSRRAPAPCSRHTCTWGSDDLRAHQAEKNTAPGLRRFVTRPIANSFSTSKASS